MGCRSDASRSWQSSTCSAVIKDSGSIHHHTALTIVAGAMGFLTPKLDSKLMRMLIVVSYSIYISEVQGSLPPPHLWMDVVFDNCFVAAVLY